MQFINIIFIILTIIIFIIIIYLFIFLPNQFNKTVNNPISTIINEIKPKINFNKDDLNKYKYPELVPNLDNKNIPIDINPNACKNMVMDYDEINLNSVKSEAEKMDIDITKHTEQKLINMDKDKKTLELTELTMVRTYMGLPGYKPYNIQDTNNYELKENNNGSTNYIKLKDTESFKPCNSLINSK